MKRIVLVFLLSVCANTCFSDEVLEIPANPEKGFRYPYLIKIPETVPEDKKLYLIVESNNTGKVSDDFSIHYESAKKTIVGNAVGPWLSKKLSYPILMPVFPRPESQWQVYTHALDRDSMQVESLPYERLDLQLIAMIEDAKRVLAERSLDLQQKIILAGFSASGTFANRFSLLHPETTEIVVAGGLNGTLMLPIGSMGEHNLKYPLGISDFKQVTGKEFNLSQWLKIKQFLFMGENDTNDAVAYDDAYSEEERVIIYKTTGKEIQPERWNNSQRIYLESKARVIFRTFEGVGHGTNGDVHREFLTFVKKNALQVSGQ
ncbi:hypothetical protein [Microbulbifer variabilis]|uniref:hypothetical protein n=1 Tax=Microbulbifer variabilis TaxID=266805 RepID=UPI00036CC3AD|nr:hypothetical protein [Microbulbifer variabilis]